MNPLFTALQSPPTPAHFKTTPPRVSIALHAVATAVDAVLNRVLSLFSSSYKKNICSKLVAEQVLPSLALTSSEVTSMQMEADEALEKMDAVLQTKFQVNSSCSLDCVALAASQKPLSERKIVLYFLEKSAIYDAMRKL